LALGALDDLNDEAADITIIEAETGCRQSEIYNVPPEDIYLDHPIPHFLIRNVEPDDLGGTEGREIKNKHSKREVVLVGIGLAAMRRHPSGFPRYRGTVGPSALVNNYFRSHGLFPSSEHTIGGLRHSLESRMKVLGLHPDDRGDMMGHSVQSARKRELYGDAMPLEVKHLIASAIALGDALSPREKAAAKRQLKRRGIL
jgi:hypothetical protein